MVDPNPENESLGQRIRMKRQDMRITQEEMATRLEVSPQHISAIEVNRRLPSLSFIAYMAIYLGVTTDYLITGKHPQTSDPIAAIMGDDTIPEEAKKALVTMVKVSRQAH